MAVAAQQRPADPSYRRPVRGAIGSAARTARVQEPRRGAAPTDWDGDRSRARDLPYDGHPRQAFLLRLIYILEFDFARRLGGRVAPVSLPRLHCLDRPIELVEPVELAESIPYFINWN